MILKSPITGRQPVIHERAFIAPSAIIIGDVVIGEGTNVWPGAVIRAENSTITIGRDCSIQENAVLHTDPASSMSIGDRVLIGHCAMVHGPGDVGNDTLIGISAVKLQNKAIGEGCLIGAGAVVTKTIAPFSKTVGSPAEVKETLGPEQVKLMGMGTMYYADLGKQFREAGMDQRSSGTTAD